MSSQPPPHSLRAWLPDGTPFVPNASPTDREAITCAGPDADGSCPALKAGHVPACQPAIWLLERADGRSTSFHFRGEVHTCPVLLLTGAAPPVGGSF